MAKIIVVVPNHLPTLDFLKEWDVLKDVELIIVQDIGDKPTMPEGFTGVIYDHSDIKKDLGKSDWIIPSRSSACRSYGYYKAWQAGADYIYTLDNDCFPDGSDFLAGHLKNLEGSTQLGWVTSTLQHPFTRGFPYGMRGKNPIGVSHGLWSKVPDLDAATSLHNPDLRFTPVAEEDSFIIPLHNYYPMCGMNLAWRAELTPVMYFGIFGPDYGFDQYDDIWAGVLSKKVMDHLGYAVLSGYPSVEHRKQSNVYVNLKKQAPGLAMNETFWEAVDAIELTSADIVGSYKELIEKLPDKFDTEPEGWTAKFKKAALLWIDLFA